MNEQSMKFQQKVAGVSVLVIIIGCAYLIWSLWGKGIILAASPVVIVVASFWLTAAAEKIQKYQAEEKIKQVIEEKERERLTITEDLDLTQVPIRGCVALKADIRFYYKDGNLERFSIIKGSTQKVA